MSRLLIRLLPAFLALAIPTSAAAYPDGGYLAVGIGGAVASGDRGVSLKPGTAIITVPTTSDVYKESVRTDFASGLALELRFGYLIAGILAPEISLGGHGSPDFENGAGYPSFVLRYHPIQHFIPHDTRPWDANLYAGVGYAIGGYHPDDKITDGDGKGWDGIAVLVGFGFDYQVADSVSIGADVRFALPQYSTFIYNRSDDITFEPSSTPSTLVVMPTLQAVFHL